MSYQVKHHKLFEKDIVKIPKHHQQKIYRIIQYLKTHPQQLPSNSNILKGYKDVYRTRFGNFRCIYQINHKNKIVFVLGVEPRGKVYKIIRRLLN